MQQLFASILLLLSTIAFAQPATITFPSRDSLTITADLYKIDEAAPFIILCHQAGYSRGEYTEIAKKLNKMGYNCLAIDQRSGGSINGIVNETYELAKKKGMPTEYLDAEKDIIAAINYVHYKYKRKIIVWGSSYSASLALKLLKDKKVAAAIAFSPGEYFKGKLNITKSIAGTIEKPLFVTSTLSESEEVRKLIKEVRSLNKIHFTPQREGVHGSSALWATTPNNQEYWLNLKDFLNSIKSDMFSGK